MTSPRRWLNQRVATVDALGNRSTVAFDAAGNVLAVTNARGYTTTYAYDAAGQQTTVKDALGNVTTTAYDAASEVTAVTDPRGSAWYDSSGNEADDKCAWTGLFLENGFGYQPEWSNSAHGCVQ